jgi:hypothetical protein
VVVLHVEQSHVNISDPWSTNKRVCSTSKVEAEKSSFMIL